MEKMLYVKRMLKKLMLAGIMSIIITMVGINPIALADVYTCKLDPCSRWVATTETEKNLKANTRDNPTVLVALANSQDDGVVNSVKQQTNPKNIRHLYIKQDLWHKGGDPNNTFPTYQHLTVYLYQNDVPQKTCHVYSTLLRNLNKYATTCQKSRQ